MTAGGLRDLHARTVRASVAVVSQVNADHDLDRPTPCDNWTLGRLLAHMTVQHHGFAAAAAGNGGDPAIWVERPLGADPVAAYARAAEGVIAAFARDNILEQEFALPEISPLTTFPGRQAIGFHVIDYVVHAWDVARTIDAPLDLDQDVLDTGWMIARAVPNGPERLRCGAAFAPGLAAPEDAAVLDQILAYLGRSPSWPF